MDGLTIQDTYFVGLTWSRRIWIPDQLAGTNRRFFTPQKVDEYRRYYVQIGLKHYNYFDTI
jgi:hypothetical protein